MFANPFALYTESFGYVGETPGCDYSYWKTRKTAFPERSTVALSLLRLQSGVGDKPVKFQVVCPPNGTAVLIGG